LTKVAFRWLAKTGRWLENQLKQTVFYYIRHRMKKALFSLLLLTLLISACRKDWERPSWEVDVLAPVFHTQLTIHDLLADSLIQINGDSSVSLLFNSTVYRMSLDSLVDLPDTAFADTFMLPSIIPSVNVNPGQQIFSQTEEKKFYGGEAELKRIITEAGTCQFNIVSTINQPTDYTYSITNAVQNSQPFTITVTVPPGSISNPAVYSGSYDLAGYDFDLTGSSGSEYNTYRTTLSVKLNTNASATTVTNQDYVIIETKFIDIIPAYATGYFGSELISMPVTETDFDAFDRIISGSIDIDQLDVNLILRNGIGADARVVLSQLSSVNTSTSNTVDLTHAIISNDVNINRAQDINNGPVPSVYTVNLNNGNSNIDQLFENLPDKFSVLLDATINPLGNVSAHSDFFYSTGTLEADLEIEMPLSLIATDLVIADTFDIDVNKGENGYVTHGKLNFFVENGFPFDAVIELWILDANLQPVSMVVTQENILSAYTNAQNIVTAPRNSIVMAELDNTEMEQLYNAEKVMMLVKFNTSSQVQHVTVYDDYYFDIKLTADFNFKIEQQQ